MSAEKKQPDYLLWSLLLLLCGVVGGAGYLWYQNEQLSSNLKATERSLSEQIGDKTKELAVAGSRIAELEATLEQVRDDLEDLEDDYRDEKDKNDEFEDQIKKITGTVRDLDKLSKTDEELLQKYSKVYFLNENYIPSDLDEIDEDYVLASKVPQYFHGDAVKFLEDMIEEAEDDNVDLRVLSAYRSFDQQQELKGQFTTAYGSGANAFSADQGYSEHQLGTAVDFVTEDLTSAVAAFADTDAYRWLLKNAHKYGFTLSYPEDNTFYIFEPWHWRFVGEELATDLRDDNAHFYDWEQRKIDTYLLEIFD